MPSYTQGLQGVLGGATLGTSFGGPGIGTAIGAGIGGLAGLAGLFGSGYERPRRSLAEEQMKRGLRSAATTALAQGASQREMPGLGLRQALDVGERLATEQVLQTSMIRAQEEQMIRAEEEARRQEDLKRTFALLGGLGEAYAAQRYMEGMEGRNVPLNLETPAPTTLTLPGLLGPGAAGAPSPTLPPEFVGGLPTRPPGLAGGLQPPPAAPGSAGLVGAFAPLQDVDNLSLRLGGPTLPTGLSSAPGYPFALPWYEQGGLSSLRYRQQLQPFGLLGSQYGQRLPPGGLFGR